jgi:hypothetical protein
MPSTGELGELVAVLNKEYSASDKYTTFRALRRMNRVPELLCVLACELGEKASEIGLYELDVDSWNNTAVAGGLLMGGAYALWHVFKDAKERSQQAKLLEAVKYAGATESGCVVAATLTEWQASSFFNPTTPYDAASLVPGVASLPLAYIIGLNVMSAISYFQAREAGQFIVPQNSLYILNTTQKQDLEKAGLSVKLGKEGEKLVITGRNNSVTLIEKRVKGANATLVVRSPIVRYDHEAEHAIHEFVEAAFDRVKLPLKPIENIYAHNH